MKHTAAGVAIVLTLGCRLLPDVIIACDMSEQKKLASEIEITVCRVSLAKGLTVSSRD